MRLSSSLRRFRWAVFVVWLLLLVPALYLGGEPVRPSHRWRIRGRRIAVAVRAEPTRGAVPRPGGVAPCPGRGAARGCVVRRHGRRGRAAGAASPARCPSVKVVPNPQQPPPQPDRPYVVTLQLDFNNTGAVDVAKQLRQKVGIHGDQPGEIAERQGQALRHRAGRARRRGDSGHQARHRPGRAVEPSDRPDCLARGVRFAGRRRDAAGARHLHGRGHHGPGLSAVDVHARCRCS